MSTNPDLQAGLITKHKEGDQEVITHTQTTQKLQ